MSNIKLWLAQTFGSIGMRFVVAHCRMMDEMVPNGLPRGELDALCYLLADTLKATSVSIVRVSKGDWCNCGKQPRHRQENVGLNSFGARDDELAHYFESLAAGLEHRLRVARHEQHGTPVHDA